ncbi:MAG TPA: hypothetical protein VK588_07845 [Chitinophagaceae bacterium]|nr:hypothetical protein [Chitinophagaceae bacterium]
MRSFLLSVMMCCTFLFCRAQSYTWWENTVHWDGVTPWERYIVFTAGFLGPNALPVPHITNGSIDSVNSIGMSGDVYFSKDDHTQDISLYANYCLVKNKVSFDIYWVPVEHFDMSYDVKTERHVFPLHYYDHFAKGDVHLNTNIQLFNNNVKNIHSSLRIGYRFPSSEIGAARFTDAPGYYFDVSFAKGFHSHPTLKWIAMAGGYFWQAEIRRHPQDDAFLFGSGLEWNKKNLRIQTSVAGYLGYFYRLRDKPILYRASLEKTIKRKIVFFQFQQGLHNFNYTTIGLGMKYRFGK